MAPPASLERDLYDLPLTTTAAPAAEAYRRGQEALLAQAVAPEALIAGAVAADPAFALGHSALALIQLRELRLPEARASAERGVALAARATRREQQHALAIADAVHGRTAEAIARMQAHLAEFPRDALLLNNITTSLLFAGRQDEMVQVTEPAGAAYGADDWFYLGVHAFALQEVRRFAEARRAALRSLDLFPLAAFTTHALAHVFYELGEYAEGVGFMPGWLARYDRRAGLHLHLSWHLALFLLARGQYGEVFALYDRAIRPAARPGPFALFDPVSLLWRLDAYSGGAHAEQWAELGVIAADRAATPGQIFADLHHGMALIATGRQTELDGLLGSFAARGRAGNTTAGEVALPLLQGLAAFAQGDYATAVRLLEPIEARIFLVGGSKAQREVFYDTLLEALLRSGRFAAAEQRLRERLDRRPAPRDFFRLARAAAGDGRSAEARRALAATEAGWATADPTAPEPAEARLLAQRLVPV